MIAIVRTWVTTDPATASPIPHPTPTIFPEILKLMFTIGFALSMDSVPYGTMERFTANISIGVKISQVFCMCCVSATEKLYMFTRGKNEVVKMTDSHLK